MALGQCEGFKMTETAAERKSGDSFLELLGLRILVDVQGA
jgi:hypothetical protein